MDLKGTRGLVVEEGKFLALLLSYSVPRANTAQSLLPQ